MANPVLSEKIFKRFRGEPYSESGTMTFAGTADKTALLLTIVVVSALFTWNTYSQSGVEAVAPFIIIGAFAGLILAIVTAFRPTIAMVTAPIYAVCEGLVLGGISASYEDLYSGITIQAVSLTFAIFLTMLAAYRFRIIRPTQRLVSFIVAATFGIAGLYIIDILLNFAHLNVPFLHDSGPVGIIVSLVIVGIAAFNFIIDFGFVESGVERGAPRSAEWYGAFGLTVTLVWLYLEILRLISKLRN